MVLVLLDQLVFVGWLCENLWHVSGIIVPVGKLCTGCKQVDGMRTCVAQAWAFCINVQCTFYIT
jgi:hypothetical protein